MRPTTSSTGAWACPWVSFSRLTSRSVWPAVTLRASVSPASTKSCEMSLRTTGMPAAAMVWAIWPPMVPAPTTAALNTNMLAVRPPFRGLEGAEGYLFAGELCVGLQLACEAGDGAPQRVADGPADEEEVREGLERPALLEPVLHGQAELDAVLVRREGNALDAGHLGVVNLGGLAEAGLVLGHPLEHAAAARRRGLPHERRGRRGPVAFGADDVGEPVDERRPPAGVVPELFRLRGAEARQRHRCPGLAHQPRTSRRMSSTAAAMASRRGPSSPVRR